MLPSPLLWLISLNLRPWMNLSLTPLVRPHAQLPFANQSMTCSFFGPKFKNAPKQTLFGQELVLGQLLPS